MEQWRERGYVPDSDEEDDELDSQHLRLEQGKEHDKTNRDEDGQSHDILGEERNNEDGITGQHTQAGAQESDQNSDEHEGLVSIADEKTEQTANEQLAVDTSGENAKGTTDGKKNDVPLVVVQIPAPRAEPVPTTTSNDVDEIDELGDDPLQDDTGPIVRRVQHQHRKLSSLRHQPEAGPPSSPDEIQFAAHYQRPEPVTPVRQSPKNLDNGLEFGSGSSSSSPLSSPPSNIETPTSYRFPSPHLPEISRSQISTLERKPSVSPRTAPPQTDPPQTAPVVIPDEPPTTQHERILRPRNPAQINPFLFDDARYRRICRAAGVRPVKSFFGTAQQPTNESQEDEFRDENASPPSSPSQTFRFLPSSPGKPRVIPDKRKRNSRSSDFRPLADPSKRTTLGSEARRLGAKVTYSGLKRRKLSHVGGHTHSSRSNAPEDHSVQVLVDNNGPVGMVPNDQSIFEFPVSPPDSGSPATSRTDQDRPRFRYLRASCPIINPTPTIESRPNNLAEASESILHISSLPEPTGDQAQDEVDVVSTSGSSHDEAAELEEFRRKIKGVLPASWLRLDRQMQQEKERLQVEKEKTRRLRNERQSGKGVARRISRSSRARESRPTFSIPDDSTSESDDLPVGSVQGSARRPRQTINEFLGLSEDDFDDIPEDNRIDYMYPTAPRQRTKIENRVVSKPKGASGASTRGSEHKRQPRQTRITDSVNRRAPPRKTKPRAPRIGILDAPDVLNQPIDKQPQFLRVAARQARSRRDQGRASPTRKVFRLSTRADTEDANVALREWKRGTIRPRANNNPRPVTQDTPRPRAPRRCDLEERVSLGTGESVRAQSVRSTVLIPEGQPNREVSPAGDGSVNTGRRGSASAGNPKPANNRRQRRIVRNDYVLLPLKRKTQRPADLDDIAVSATRQQPISSFEHSLSVLNAEYRKARSSTGNLGLVLDRFLSQTNRSVQRPRPQLKSVSTKAGEPRQQTLENVVQRQRAPRKRKPRRVNAEAIEYRQPPLPLIESGPASLVSVEEPDSPCLRGLSLLGPEPSVDFDTSPLQIGTFFHESTFVGSGAFSRSLHVTSRDMDTSTGYAAVFHNDVTFRWGSWTETTYTEIETLFEGILETVNSLDNSMSGGMTEPKSTNLEVYRSFICYVNDNLTFIDPIDRQMFVDKSLKLLSRMNDVDFQYDSSTARDYYLRLQVFSLVLSNQVRQVAAHELVDKSKLSDITNLIFKFATRIFGVIVSDAGIKNVRLFLEENRLREIREVGIKEQYPFVEAYLVTHEIVYNQPAISGQMKEDVFSKVLMVSKDNSRFLGDVRRHEKTWFALFSMLPLQELDEYGILRPGYRFEKCHDQWDIVKQLVSKVFETYEENPRSQPVSLNNYLRSLFRRCLYLIQNWGWRQCKPILETLFDFFARNGLHNLHNEETHGSPKFLDDLGPELRIESDSRDSCFHTLLKMIAMGFRLISNSHNKKYIRNLAWRLLPNHGRYYPKEEPLRQQDLDALRNHHDLLCTLYVSTPTGCRPRLDTIRNLVHPANSHGEACGINIHAWLKLIKFKLSTDEDHSDLAEFANWHSHFTAEILKQHSLARTEIEAQDSKGSPFSPKFVERTISANQRRIESLISSALVCMKAGIDAARHMEQAKVLIEGFPLEKLLGLFNPELQRVAPVICQALDVVISYAAASSRSCTSEFQRLVNQASESQTTPETSEDSQEYGDWTGFAELCDVEMQDIQPCVQQIDHEFRPILSQFVSRCFGEDRAPDDSVLLKVIDTWISVTHVLVVNKLRQWSSYLNPYDADSWLSLRSTDQTRRFTPYFLAKMVEKDSATYFECRVQLLTGWLITLVERGSMLKYQHQLTNALLNNGCNDPILKNLPFTVNRSSGQYEITLDELCQRRLSLVSCILSNMREHLFEVEQQTVAARTTITDQYKEMIQGLMGAMKQNYKELGTGNAPVQGSYVDFVHRIVEFLQQHSQGICPLDQFFTNPASFPLPASDPTYIVAKLKSYGIRMFSGKTSIQLVTFVQQVSERAVMDGQQTYLVDQLYNAMSNTFEAGDGGRPTLRAILLQSIFPAYVETAFSSPVALLLVQPLLHAIARMFTDLMLDIDATKSGSVRDVVELIRTYFEATDNSLQLLVDHPGLLEEPSVLLTLSSFLETVIASLPVIDYLDRSTDRATTLVAYVDRFRQFAIFSISSLFDPATALVPDSVDSLQLKYNCYNDDQRPLPPTYFTEARDYATRELQTRLRTGWSVYEGRYFIQQGQQSREVRVDPACKSVEVAKETFVRSVEVLFGNLVAFDSLRVLSGCDDSTWSYKY